MNYQSAKEKLGNRTRRKLENNTYLELRDNGDIAVKLHATDVVTYKPNGDTVLNTGGWHTVTTRDRINKYSNANISQKQGVWYVDNIATFADGMIVKPNGTLEGAGDDPKKELKLRKQVRKFADEYMRKLAAGEIKPPSSGDCWGCYYRTQNGESGMGSDHMLEHIKENYYVPSMIQNAFKQFGAAPVQRWALSDIWNGKTDSNMKSFATDGRSKRMLVRHIYSELGLAA